MEIGKLKEMVEEMKKDPETLKKAFDNIGEILPVVKLIQKEAKKELIDEWIRRLGTAAQEDVIFPFAGQEFRNKVIEFMQGEKDSKI